MLLHNPRTAPHYHRSSLQHMIKEACVETLHQAQQAEALGADQIELCSRLDLDGLTPDKDLVRQVLASLNIKVKVMVRPRSGNFVYDEMELQTMMGSIERFKSMGVQEVVFGVLESTTTTSSDGQEQQYTIDVAATKRLADAAAPMSVTFHKAFDLLHDPILGMQQLVDIGSISSVLTSGGQQTAEQGAKTIEKLHQVANGKLQIIAGGKITDKNLGRIQQLLPRVDAFHGKLIVGHLD